MYTKFNSHFIAFPDESARPEKPIPCDICGKEVLWLAEHKKSVHPEEVGEERGEHPCPECGKVCALLVLVTFHCDNIF